MKRLLCSLVFSLGTCSVFAQNISYDSVRIAELWTESTTQIVDNLLPSLIITIEANLKSSGGTEKGSKALAEAIRNVFTTDNLSRVVAQMISDKLNPDDQRQLLVFLQSPLGKKFLLINKETTSDTKYLTPLFKQACDAAKGQLGFFDRGSLNSICGNL